MEEPWTKAIGNTTDEVMLKIPLQFFCHFKGSQDKLKREGKAAFRADFFWGILGILQLKKSRCDHLIVHLLMWVACNVQGMSGTYAALCWHGAGVAGPHLQGQRELVYWEYVGLGVISGQSGITEPAAICTVSRLSVITACRHTCRYPQAYIPFVVYTDNVKINVKDITTTFSLSLHCTWWKGAGKDATAPGDHSNQTLPVTSLSSICLSCAWTHRQVITIYVY